MRFAVEQSPLGRVYVPTELPTGVALFYTTRDFDGFLDEPATATIRRFLRERFGFDAALWTCHQVHGTQAVRVSASSDDTWRECDQCDALWTSEPAVALGIKVADCLPVTLIDPPHAVIANIHSGWRGMASRITARTLDRLQHESAFSPGSAHAFLGPSIRQCCFEVGGDVIEQFEPSYREVERFVDRARGQRPYLDLIGLTTELLTAHGVPAHSIHDSGLCTRCDGSIFHSYRRDRARTGRNLAIAAQ